MALLLARDARRREIGGCLSRKGQVLALNRIHFAADEARADYELK